MSAWKVNQNRHFPNIPVTIWVSDAMLAVENQGGEPVLDNKTFGNFIREKRIEKGLKQRELADLLYVTESAVSKWENGKSYPDITMIPNICKTLGVTEKELIDGATDTDYRKMRKDAGRYRKISETWFWGLTISYAIALVVCLICDIAVNHRFSFSIIVFSSLLVAYSFAPTWIRFTENHKLALFVGSSYLSLCLLFATCCAFFSQTWFPVASSAVLLGYVAFFGPFLLRRYFPERFRRFNVLVYFASILVALLFMLLIIRTNVSFPYFKALAISFYAFIPFFITAALHAFDINRLLKVAVDVLAFGIFGYRLHAVVNRLFEGGEKDYYRVNFRDWANCINGNISLIWLVSSIIIAVALVAFFFAKRKH